MVMDEEEIQAAEKAVKKAVITAIFLLVGLQAGWLIVLSQSASKEINEPGAAFNEVYEFEIPNLMFTNSAMPIDFACDSKQTKNSTESEMVSWQIFDEKGRVLASGSGQAGESCGSAELELSPGIYTIQSHQGVAELEQELILHIWQSLRMEGHVVLLLITILLGGDTIARARKKVKTASTPLSTHKKAQKEVWEKVNKDMDSAGKELAEIYDIGSKPSQLELERTIAKVTPDLPVASGELEADIDQTKLIEDTDPIGMDELGVGTMRGLSGPVDKDERIRKVGDIWDLDK